MKPFLLEPIPDYTIWGTNHISKARGIDEDYGTWWEVSAHPYCSNKIVGTDKTLMEMIQENPNEVTQNKLDSEWFPYKVKLLSLPVTNDELLTIKNAALALDDGDEEPGSFSCAEWSSKLLKYIIPELDIYTLPNSLWEAVVKEKEKRIKLNGENK